MGKNPYMTEIQYPYRSGEKAVKCVHVKMTIHEQVIYFLTPLSVDVFNDLKLIFLYIVL